MTQPLVSILVPVKNGKRYIAETVDSILGQDYENFELIIVDDGSTDFDYKSLESLDPRIKVQRTTGLGVSAARNLGLAVAQGDFIAFNDADDVWFPGKLKAQIEYLKKHPQTGVVFGKFIKWHPSAKGSFPEAATLSTDCTGLVDCDPARSGWIYTRLVMGLLVGMNTALIRRQIYEQVGGFDESLSKGEDYDFWLRCSQITEMDCLNGFVALYRIHDASAMSRLEDSNNLRDLLISARARWGLTNPDGLAISARQFRKRVAKTDFDHAYKHYWLGNPTISAKSFLKSFIGGHMRFKSFIYIFLSLAKSKF